MLIFHLKKTWYDKIKAGEKTVEYRMVKPYWEKRLWKNGCTAYPDIPYDYETLKDYYPPVCCIFECGYNPETRIAAIINKVEIVNGLDTDLKIDKPVYAIHFKLMLWREKKDETINERTTN